MLVGLMGSGKTTVGRIVAERLGRQLVDTDEVIETATGRSVREIWREDGEPAFRELEAAALAAALSNPQANVIAAAGGVVLAERNRRLLSSPETTVVWLTAEPSVLVDRARTGDHRPLLDDDARGVLEQMADERNALYAGVSDIALDVSERTPEQVADEVIEWVQGE